MQKKNYFSPRLRFIPVDYLEPVCDNASGDIPGYDPIDDYPWD